MKIFLNKTVVEAAKERIRWLFQEFDNVLIGYSGGKDSTVILNLTLDVARELNRLPIPVVFIDQEAEWQGTIDIVNEVMRMPEVTPMWFQMPMVITNNVSTKERYSYCWAKENEKKWIHPQSDISIKENLYGTDRFHDLFSAIVGVEYAGQKTCYVAGVRAEESPARATALTEQLTYKDVTWGKRLCKLDEHYTFYPIYDWSVTDVWKYIHDNGIPYNRIYDEMYRHGVNVVDMRVSNLHHETAIKNLLLIQEIEPDTWNRIVARIDGANTIKHIKMDAFKCPRDLPPMFESWREYALHLAEHLIPDPKNKQAFFKKVERRGHLYDTELIRPVFWKKMINTILAADWDWTKMRNWELIADVFAHRQFVRGERKATMLKHPKYLTSEMLKELMEAVQ